jgi:tetratricopeptide (TPR) repeat protein
MKGMTLSDLGNYSEALDCIEQASDLGNYSEALDCIEQALRINPGAEPFKNAREYVLALIQNRNPR